MVGVNDPGSPKQLQVRGCVKKKFKKGMMGSPMEGCKDPQNSSLPVLVADSLPLGSVSRVVWPGAGGAEGTRSVL